MIPELTLIRMLLRAYETLYELVLENTLNLQAQYTALLLAYSILQNRYNDLETKYNNLLNDKLNTNTKKPQEAIPEVLD